MIKLEKAATKIMAVIGTAVMLFLVFYSWRYTKNLVRPEYYLDEKDSVLFNFLLCAVLLLLSGILTKAVQKIPARVTHLLAMIAAVAAAAFGIWLARAAGAVSDADQYCVQRAAKALVDGDMEWVLQQDYFGIYRFQLGLAEIFSFFFRVMGNTEAIAVQQIQAIFGGITLYVGFRIVWELSGQRLAELLYLLAEITFLPMYCYMLFVYGESLGVCSAVCAIWCYLIVSRPGGKTWTKCMYWAAIGFLMTLAYVAKSVLLVVWIAMFIMQILLALKNKSWKGIIALCGVLAVMLAGEELLCSMAERQIGQEYGSGAPYILWVAMGTQENDDPQRGPGTWNGYNADTYVQAGYDGREAARIAKDDLKKQYAEWSANPGQAITFYKEKILLQWIEPTYGGFVMTGSLNGPKHWVNELYFGQANERALSFLNRYQAVLYLAILGYYLRILSGKVDGVKILPGIIFLGGFFITIFWEAKSRYVYPYIVMILPCAACSIEYYGALAQSGLKKLRQRLMDSTNRKEQGK